MQAQKTELGATARLSRKISSSDVRKFAELSSDMNPVHLDSEYAKATRFGKPIVHGMFLASLISAVLANDLPGQGTIYLSQDLQFRKPVFHDDTVEVVLTITEFPKPHLARLSTVITNQEKEIVLEGTALVMLPPKP